MLLTGIREGQATVGPRGVLECAVLLDHGRLLAPPISEHATYDVEQLRHFMAARQDEFGAAHVKCNRVLAEWASLKEHVVKDFANVRTCKVWEALALDKAHAQWVMLRHILSRLVEVYIFADVHVHPCQR